MKPNRKFKDSVFTTLFNNPDLLRELYCALEGVTLPPDVPVSITTLKNVLYMDICNDLSFEIGGKLIVLIEHQSTLNPNMALRMLNYTNQILEKRIKKSELYSETPISIPYPEFYVLYNGEKPFQDECTQRLSDLFEKPEDLGLSKRQTPLLDLEVRIININEGKNQEIVNRCKELAGYSEFTGKARTFWRETGNLKEGIKAAVKYCQKHDILKEFLETHERKVLSMLFTEWNTEDAIAYAREESFEKGREEGHVEVLKLLDQGLSIEEIKQRLTQKGE